MGGSEEARAGAEQHMYQLGLKAGVKINYDVQTKWQPVDSQRVMLWARQFGKAEEYMDHLARGHFEKQKSASHTASILEAASKAGLPEEDVKAMLATDDYREDVWRYACFIILCLFCFCDV